MDLAALQDQNEKLRKHLAWMVSPKFLENRIRELGLNLAPLQPSQIWRLTERSPEMLETPASPVPRTDRSLARR